MGREKKWIILMIILTCFLGTGASAAVISAGNVSISSPSGTGITNLCLDSVPTGIAGYNFTFTVLDPGVATIQSIDFPPAFNVWPNVTPPLPASKTRVISIDLYSAIHPGSLNVSLCNLTFRGVSNGTTSLSITVGELTDGNGSAIVATIPSPIITVGSAGPTPTVTPTPTATQTTPTVSPTATVTSPTPTATPTQTVSDIDFRGEPVKGNAPVLVLFNPITNISYKNLIWFFGDGSSSDTASPEHVYSQPGSYSVSLLAVLANNSTTSVTKSGYIYVCGPTVSPTPTVTPTPTASPTPVPPPLISNFTASPRSGLPPLTVQFNDTSIGEPKSWKWDFGDGTMSVLQNPAHVYGDLGRYTVTLEVKNKFYQSIERKVEFITSVSGRRG